MPGYDENFLSVRVPLPTFGPDLTNSVLHSSTLVDGVRADYPNYTIVTNQVRRAPVLSALNIDQGLFKKGASRSWRIDKAIGGDSQLDNSYYKDVTNPDPGETKRNFWDRGHMAMRENASWGRTQDAAGRSQSTPGNGHPRRLAVCR